MIIRKKFIYDKQNDIDVFYSVAHVEEFFKAEKNDMKNANTEKLQEMKSLIKSLSKTGVILNPSMKQIIAKEETFEMCLKRVRTYDTRENVQRNGENLFSVIKEKKAKLQENDSTVINNSNLNSKEIWKRPEISEELKTFGSYYEAAKKMQTVLLLSCYGLEGAAILRKVQLPKDFRLYYRCFENDEYVFSLLELVIEYLNNVLCSCGYHKDKTVDKTRSGIHDVSHIIYSTYCHYFVSQDRGLIARANAIFEYLGLTTKAITLEEFNTLY